MQNVQQKTTQIAAWLSIIQTYRTIQWNLEISDLVVPEMESPVA